MNKPKYKIGDKVLFFCKYKNEQAIGEITDIREAKYNWDYSIRYYIYVDLVYAQWINEENILDKVK
jgi:hypothetical protein